MMIKEITIIMIMMMITINLKTKRTTIEKITNLITKNVIAEIEFCRIFDNQKEIMIIFTIKINNLSFSR